MLFSFLCLSVTLFLSLTLFVKMSKGQPKPNLWNGICKEPCGVVLVCQNVFLQVQGRK